MIGLERAVNDHLSVQLGVSGYGDSPIKTQGKIWQFGLPIFNDLGYSYQVQHARLMAEGKFLTNFACACLWQPYFSWQIGAAFNRASNYQEFPAPDGVPMSAPFTNHTKTSFAWGVGLGVDYQWKDHLRLGVGYQFLDLGKVSLGPTTAAITTQP